MSAFVLTFSVYKLSPVKKVGAVGFPIGGTLGGCAQRSPI